MDDHSVKEKLSNVFSGSLEKLPPPTSKVVRIFTSSTFTDTTIERNSLMEEVYPKIKEFCRETHGLDFQVVDMRWGVRDEATDDHKTTQLCMNEIKNCQRLSMGPNFVAFLCQKYGYRPLPSEIVATELDLLKQTLREMKEDVSPLETWYKQDTNAVPPVYLLQPISSILVNFNNKRMPKLQEQDSAAWWSVMGQMQKLLRKGAKASFEAGKEEMHNYFMSVTEREVINGILKARGTKDHCLCYVRHINDINLNNLRAASKFVDIDQGQIDTEATKLLSNLRDERVPSKLPAENIFRFSIDWTGRDGMSAASHSDYLSEFCSNFYQSTTRLVNRAMKKHAEFAKDRTFGEILQHLHTCLKESSEFHGRESILSSVQKYLESTSREPLILCGDPGCGKTSLVARASSCICKWSQKKPVMVLRFLGTTPDSSSIGQLLESLCEQIAFNYGHPRGTCPSELSKLVSFFKKMMGLATAEKPLVILLDSLALLSTADGAHDLLWFPPTLPENVKLIASVTSGDSRIFTNLKKIVENSEHYIDIPPLGVELAETVTQEWLKSHHRTLSPRQLEIVRKAINKSTLPIFVKLVFATICRWKSYSRPQETILAGSVHESIQALFERTENQHGKLLVAHALSYITAARSGISESELEDLISLDDKVLDDVYQYHLPPVRRIPPLLWTRIRADLPGYLIERDENGVIVLSWYHRQFHEAARERFFKSMNHVKFTHSSMADYFLGIWGGVPKPFQYTEVQRQRFGIMEKEGLADRKVPLQPNVFLSKEGKAHRYNVRKLNELPYHLLRADRFQELFSKCLFNFEFLQSKLSSHPLQALLADFEDAMQYIQDHDTQRELVLVADCLRLSASILNRYPYMLAFEFMGRLLPLIGDYEKLRSLLIQCDTEGSKIGCMLPLHHCFHSPGGPLKYSLEDHPFAVFGMKLTSDEKMVVSVSNIFIVWDISSGDVARVVRPGMDGIMFGLALSPNDKFAATYTNNNEVALMSMVTGDFQAFQPEGITTETQMMILGITVTNKNLIFWTKDEWFLYDLNCKLEQDNKIRGHPSCILTMFYQSDSEYHLVLWNGGKEDTSLTLQSFINDVPVTSLEFESAMTFGNERSVLYACMQSPMCTVKRFTLDGLTWKQDLNFNLENKVEDRIFSMTLSQHEEFLVGIEGYGFHIWHLEDEILFKLKLPDGVRNIPLRPMHTTSPTAFTTGLEYFAAGVRNNLYIFDIAAQRLVQTIDAHFGRILSLIPIPIANRTQQGLLTASIDHSIKLWNVNNIFEKSFKIDRLDKRIEKILIPRNNEFIIAVLTRKNIAIWETKRNKILGLLAASPHAAVVTHCLITADGEQIISVESDMLILWNVKSQSILQMEPAKNVQQIFFLKAESWIAAASCFETGETKIVRITVREKHSFKTQYEYQFSCRMFHDVAVMKGEHFFVAIVMVKSREFLQVVHSETGSPIHRIRLRKGKDEAGLFGIHLIRSMPRNPNQVALIDSEHKGYIFDVKNKKLLRTLNSFSGPCSSDGKHGLHAPPKGGLEIVDLRKGTKIKTLIPQVIEGVNDILADFCPSDRNIFYYHGGQKTLKIFRVSDGSMIGCFRPHANLTSFSLTKDGEICLIGGEDGSLLISWIVDPKNKKSIENLAKQPTRKALAKHLDVTNDSEEPPENQEFSDAPVFLTNLKTVGKAVNRFKTLAKKEQRSAACSVQ